MLTYGNKASWLNTIWNALGDLDIYTPEDSEQWDNVVTAMAWVAEELDVEQEDLE
jgi:hypothetical protein